MLGVMEVFTLCEQTPKLSPSLFSSCSFWGMTGIYQVCVKAKQFLIPRSSFLPHLVYCSRLFWRLNPDNRKRHYALLSAAGSNALAVAIRLQNQLVTQKLSPAAGPLLFSISKLHMFTEALQEKHGVFLFLGTLWRLLIVTNSWGWVPLQSACCNYWDKGTEEGRKTCDDTALL